MLFEVAKRNLNAQDSEILYRKIVRLLQKKSTQRGLRDLKDGTDRYFDDIPLESEHQIKKRKTSEIRQDIHRVWPRFRCKRGFAENNEGFPGRVSELGIILFLKMQDNIVILSRYC
jgi:hypothetical protein